MYEAGRDSFPFGRWEINGDLPARARFRWQRRGPRLKARNYIESTPPTTERNRPPSDLADRDNHDDIFFIAPTCTLQRNSVETPRVANRGVNFNQHTIYAGNPWRPSRKLEQRGEGCCTGLGRQRMRDKGKSYSDSGREPWNLENRWIETDKLAACLGTAQQGSLG